MPISNNPPQVSLQAMDSSHVTLVAFSSDLRISSTTAAIGTSVQDAKMSRKLRPTQDKIADFERKLMDIDSEHLGIPESEYEAIVRMSSTEFTRICKDLSAIGDTVVISVTKEGVKFSTRGDIGTANIFCRQNASADKPEEATIIEMQEPVSLTFALRYMNSFTKAIPSGNQVTFSLSSELPMVVEYKIAEMGYIRYYLAPKMAEEEEAGTYAEPAQASSPRRPSRKTKLRTKVEAKRKQEAKTEVESEPVIKSEPEEDSKTAVEINPKTAANLETEADDKVEVMETKPETKTNGDAEAMDVR